MERKKKIRIIQICLISVGLLTLIITYSDNFNFQKKNITKEDFNEKVENKILSNSDNVEGNVFYNIEYSGLDLAGNRYILKSKSAINNNIESDLIDMTGVTATFYFKDGTIMKIKM